MNYFKTLYPFTKFKNASPPTIGIFIAADDAVINRFGQHIASLTCYARRHAYPFIVVHPKQYPNCLNVSHSIVYQKHCLVLMYLIENIHIQWLLVLDIDILVINASRKIESYLPNTASQSLIHMIFYERFNGEIAAGNYLIHNHPWSHTLLSTWLEYDLRTKHLIFRNGDNGPLHLHLLGRMVGNVSQSAYDRCLRVLQNTTDHSMYHTYVGCCKCALDGRWEFEHVRILRRGHSFVRDNLGYDTNERIWAPTDFLIHGQKKNVEEYYSKEIDVYTCVTTSWVVPLREDVTIRDYALVKELVRKHDLVAVGRYPQSVGIPDISDCWPNCRDTEARRRTYMKSVCNENATWRLF